MLSAGLDAPSTKGVPIGESRTLRLTFQILTLGALGMATLLALVPAAGHDQLWFLLLAERWLHAGCGRQTLYGPTAFDSNTPAIIWLSALPVLCARALHLGVPFCAKLLFTLFELTIALFSFRILAPPARLRPALAFLFVTLFAVLPARDFGQRDLLTTLLCLPYLILAGKRFGTRKTAQAATPLRLIVTSLAAAGVCFKPQLALIPIVVELFFILRRQKRFEPFLFLLLGACFLLAIRLFAPFYLSSALPVTRATYWAIGHLSPAQLLLQSPELHLLLAATLTVVFLRRHHLQPQTPIFLLAGLAGTASFYLQGTGWYYQQLPGLILLALTLAGELLAPHPDSQHPTPDRPWLPPAAAALCLLALTLTFHFSGYPFSLHPFTPDRTDAIESPAPAFFRNLPPGTPVATLTTSVDDAIMPVFRYQLTWSQRTNNLWTLPAILRASQKPNPQLPASALAALTQQQQQWMAEDLARWRPTLLLVERCHDPAVPCQEIEDLHPNLLAFFLENSAFAALFEHYRYLRTEGAYDAYVLTP